MKALIRTLAPLGLAGMVLTASLPAAAQQLCGAREDATKQLENRFEERVVGRGLAQAGKKMFELFVSEKGSWTMMISDPNGRTCVLVSGENWQEVMSHLGDPA